MLQRHVIQSSALAEIPKRLALLKGGEREPYLPIPHSGGQWLESASSKSIILKITRHFHIHPQSKIGGRRSSSGHGHKLVASEIRRVKELMRLDPLSSPSSRGVDRFIPEEELQKIKGFIANFPNGGKHGRRNESSNPAIIQMPPLYKITRKRAPRDRIIPRNLHVRKHITQQDSSGRRICRRLDLGLDVNISDDL
ncbi:hypothetical protein TNCV_4448341 [Trichonephila clavipes]|nr:hypothetical protein TNCV_4448341 [Trichonephila clavipes]